MAITIKSFSYRHDVPSSDLLLDCRELPNPHNQSRFRDLTGRDACVKKWLMGFPQTRALLDHAAERAKKDMTIAFGCIGGRHRSVALAELLATRLKWLTNPGFEVQVEHMTLQLPPSHGVSPSLPAGKVQAS